MTDAMRHNAGKPQLGYVLSMPSIVARTLLGGEETNNNSVLGDLIDLLGAVARGGGYTPIGEAVTYICSVYNVTAIDVSAVFEAGAKKYARGNYLLGGPMSQYVDCIARHLYAYCQGVDTDEETGCKHMAHIIWNLGMIEYMLDHADGEERDDRLYLASPGLGLKK